MKPALFRHAMFPEELLRRQSNDPFRLIPFKVSVS